MITVPPVRMMSTKKAVPLSSASVCAHPTAFYAPPLPSPSLSLRSSSPTVNSPAPNRPIRRHFRHDGPVDQDVFRRAYERAISVARSRLLFRDPYSLTRSSATHGVLYSYYDHTPMCVFSRGNSCNHHDHTRQSKSDLSRKKIFNDVIVEQYIQYDERN